MRNPNILVVHESTFPELSVIALSKKKASELKLERGDTVVVQGKTGKESVCLVFTRSHMDNDHIQISRDLRINLGIDLLDSASVYPCPNVGNGKTVQIYPMGNTADGLTAENLLQLFVKPYFADSYRPVHENDEFYIRGGGREVMFKVVKTYPSPYCIVAPGTIIDILDDSLPKKVPKLSAVVGDAVYP